MVLKTHHRSNPQRNTRPPRPLLLICLAKVKIQFHLMRQLRVQWTRKKPCRKQLRQSQALTKRNLSACSAVFCSKTNLRSFNARYVCGLWHVCSSLHNVTITLFNYIEVFIWHWNSTLLFFKGLSGAFCTRACCDAYKREHNVTAYCEYCKQEKVVKDAITYEKQLRYFCCEGG